MRAISLDRFGGPLTLTDVPQPARADGEVLVRISHSAVNPLDVWACQGNFAALTPLPHIPGTEAIGTRADGTTVLVTGAGVGIARQGTYAQFVAAPEAACTTVPSGVDPVQAVTMGIAGVTAFSAVVTLAAVTERDVVLVLGASGGVGSLAVQIARNLGARVLGQTSNLDKSAGVLTLGAERAVVAADGAALEVALAGTKPTVVIDGLGGTFTAAAIASMAPFGRLVNYGTSAGVEVTLNMRNLYRNGITVHGYTGLLTSPQQRADALAVLFADVTAGRVRSSVDGVLPLASAGEAHRRILQREVQGKLVLDVNA